MPVATTSDAIAAAVDRLVESWCRRHRPESMSTDWGQSLLAYGLLAATRATGNADAREYLRRWLTYHLGAGVHVTYFVGSWSIGLLFPDVVETFAEFAHPLRALAAQIDAFIRDVAIRNGRGVILHNVDLPHVYVDTIYFTAPVLAKISRTLGRDDWSHEAMRQLGMHLDVLRDASGFSIHCQENRSGHRSEGAWARGNGWVMMTCAELLQLLRPDSAERRDVAATLATLSTALLPFQTEQGLWRTLIDDPDSYEETSASAMFLFAMIRGRRDGVLTAAFDETIDSGISALLASIDDTGRFTGCSEGTWPGDRAYYRSLDRGEWWWGTGAALLALCAALPSDR